MSTFDATRPLNTAWLAGTKIGVATLSIFAGMAVIAVSFWFSAPLVYGFIDGVEVLKENILNYFDTMPAVDLVFWLFVRLVQFCTLVAFMAVLHTTYALYSDRLTFGVLGLIIYASVVPPLIATKIVPVSFGLNHVWLVTGLIAAGAGYLIHALAKNRIMKPGHIAVFVFGWILYALAYFYLLEADGALDADVPAQFIVFRVAVCLLSLAVFALAPWSLAKTRHR